MLNFNFPAVSAEPLCMELTDLEPMPDLNADWSFLPFRYGTAVLFLSLVCPGNISLIPEYDTDEEEQEVFHGSCGAEIPELLVNHYLSHT